MTFFKDIKTEYLKLSMTPRRLTVFSFILAAALLFFSLQVEHGVIIWSLRAAAFTSVAVGFMDSRILATPYRFWMLCALVIGWFVLHIVLVLVYIVFITPLGILFYVIGKDPMQRRIDKKAETYWIDTEQHSAEQLLKKF